MNISTQRALSRRTFLKAAGTTLALPWLEAMCPAFAKAEVAKKIPRRMVAIETNMGIMPQFFSPRRTAATTPSRRIWKSSPHIVSR